MFSTFATQSGWESAPSASYELTTLVAKAIQSGQPVAYILEADDNGTQQMRDNAPHNVTIFRTLSECNFYVRRNNYPFAAIVAVSPRLLPPSDVPMVQYYPLSLHLGVDHQSRADAVIAQHIVEAVRKAGFAPQSIATIGSISDHRFSPVLSALETLCPAATVSTHEASALAAVKIPNPSERVFQVKGCYGVAEAAALIQHPKAKIVIERIKCKITVADKIQHYTYALAMTMPEKSKEKAK